MLEGTLSRLGYREDFFSLFNGKEIGLQERAGAPLPL